METVVLHAVHVCVRMVSFWTLLVWFVGVPGAWRLDRPRQRHCTAGVLTVSGAASASTRLLPVFQGGGVGDSARVGWKEPQAGCVVVFGGSWC